MQRKYDLVVLGGGPACGPAARRCREAGWSVAVVEAGLLGGVCPHTGCNPKKVLMAGPEAVAAAAHLAGKGLVGGPTVDWPTLMAFKRTFTAPIEDRIEASYKEAGIDVVRGRGVLTGPHTVRVGETEITAQKILIAVGATPQSFSFPGVEHLSTSDDFLDLDALPERIVFIGGGFIAFELAHIVATCGARATILTHGDKALRRFDQSAVTRLIDVSRAMGVDVRLGAPVTRLGRAGDALIVETPVGEVAADLVVNAAGRPPHLSGLGLEAAGVTATARGIVVNDYMQCPGNPDIYAAGDCLDAPYALTPTADLESHVAGENMVSGNTTTIDRRGTPSVLFTLPPLAMVGLTEDDCRARGLACVKKETALADSFPWKRLGETAGYAKTLVSSADDSILGAHILGHAAEEIINVVALAMRQNLPAEALRQGIWAYPTAGYYLRYMF
jgi:glutathione reductase (NADPH)